MVMSINIFRVSGRSVPFLELYQWAKSFLRERA